MHKMHTTKEGKTLLIGQMTDSHLSNTINLIINNILKSLNLTTPEIDKRTAAIYGFNVDEMMKSAHHKVPYALDALYPYLAEYMLRHGDNTEKMQGMQFNLRELMGRHGQLNTLLPVPEERSMLCEDIDTYL